MIFIKFQSAVFILTNNNYVWDNSIIMIKFKKYDIVFVVLKHLNRFKNCPTNANVKAHIRINKQLGFYLGVWTWLSLSRFFVLGSLFSVLNPLKDH